MTDETVAAMATEQVAKLRPYGREDRSSINQLLKRIEKDLAEVKALLNEMKERLGL